MQRRAGASPASYSPLERISYQRTWYPQWAYIAGGLLPLSGYYFTATPAGGLRWSVLITLLCLLAFGYFKSRLTGQPPVAGALRMAAIGVAAARAAYFVARLVQGG